MTVSTVSTSAALPLIVVLGPTAVGKTSLAIDLCRGFGGEIIGADSRQIYRWMDIGTAKPTRQERSLVRHHLVDVRRPDEVLTLAEYQTLAYAAIADVHRRGRVPFLVGGTALYLRAVVQGLRIPEAPPDPELRARLEAQLSADGLASLVEQLTALDPATAAVIDRRNPRRVLRALEIVLTTGRPKVELESAAPPPYRTLQLGLTLERAALHRRIDARVDEMVQQGLVAESYGLFAAGFSPTLPALTSLGYREIRSYLRGELPLLDAIERIKVETHRYVRHQSTWFRKMAPIHWLDARQPAEPAAALLDAFLSR